MHIPSFAIGFLAGVIACAFTATAFLFVRPWIRSFFSGARVSLIQIIGMRLRGTSPNLLIDALITLKMRGHDVSMAVVETCYLANRSKIFESTGLATLVEQELAKKST